MLAGPLGRRHPPWMQECRLACWRAGWGFIRSRLTTYRTGKFLDARRKPVRAFQESHCGTKNAVVYLHPKLNSVWDRHPNHCNTFIPDVIALKIQRGERRALPQHPRQDHCPFLSYVMVFKIQRGDRLTRSRAWPPTNPPAVSICR